MSEVDWQVKLPIKKVTSSADGSVTFTGWASIVTKADGTPIVDSDGDIIPVDELEKAVHTAALEAGGGSRAGVMHEFDGVIDVVESMVISREKREALGFGEGPEGWVVTCKSVNPGVVKAVREGAMLEMSIRGWADSDEVASPAATGILESIKRNILDAVTKAIEAEEVAG